MSPCIIIEIIECLPIASKFSGSLVLGVFFEYLVVTGRKTTSQNRASRSKYSMNCTHWITWVIFSRYVKRQFSTFVVMTFSCNKMARLYFYWIRCQIFLSLFSSWQSLGFLLNVVHDNLISLLKFWSKIHLHTGSYLFE